MLCCLGVFAACQHTPKQRDCAPLPKANSQLQYFDEASKQQETSTIKVCLKTKGNVSSIPDDLSASLIELEQLLPTTFKEKLARYYGLKSADNPESSKLSEQDEERLDSLIDDLNSFLFMEWALNSDSLLARQFSCLGVFEKNLHNFYLLWVDSKSASTKAMLDDDVSKEIYQLKKRLRKQCNLTPLHFN